MFPAHRCRSISLAIGWADYIGLLPLGGNLGFGVPIVSYNQNLYFTMMAEPNLMPDPERMKSLVEEVFEKLKRSGRSKSVITAR
jgi:hypothetical protein